MKKLLTTIGLVGLLSCSQPTKVEEKIVEIEKIVEVPTFYDIEYTLNAKRKDYVKYMQIFAYGVVINNEDFDLRIIPILKLYNNSLTNLLGEYEGELFKDDGLTEKTEILQSNQGAYYTIFSDELEKTEGMIYYTLKFDVKEAKT